MMAKQETQIMDEEDLVVQQIMQEECQEEKKEEPLPEESKVGKTLSDITTKTVIIMVLCVMFIVPLFTFSTYVDETSGAQAGLSYICAFESDTDPSGLQSVYWSFFTRHRSIGTPLIYLEAGPLSYEDSTVDINALRLEERNLVYPTNSSCNSFYVAIFDMRSSVQLDSMLSIIQTIFVCIVLTIGAIIFTKDANDLVIGPIEQMMIKVQRIARNPLDAAKEEENEAVAMHKIEKDERAGNGCFGVYISSL